MDSAFDACFVKREFPIFLYCCGFFWSWILGKPSCVVARLSRAMGHGGQGAGHDYVLIRVEAEMTREHQSQSHYQKHAHEESMLHLDTKAQSCEDEAGPQYLQQEAWL